MSNQNINPNDLDVLIGKLQELREEDAKFIKILLILHQNNISYIEDVKANAEGFHFLPYASLAFYKGAKNRIAKGDGSKDTERGYFVLFLSGNISNTDDGDPETI